jgi:hypothetical protein
MDLAKHVKDGCKDEDMVGLIFNTIGVSDAITMGTDGWCSDNTFFFRFFFHEVPLQECDTREYLYIFTDQPINRRVSQVAQSRHYRRLD